jgi:hypothetical protein
MKSPATDRFLDEIKSAGRSSPAGQHWQRFWSGLDAEAPSGSKRPPPPLILAAAGESAAVKHNRLRAQLEFAYERGIEAQALAWLAVLPPDAWNHSSAMTWHRSSDAWD